MAEPLAVTRARGPGRALLLVLLLALLTCGFPTASRAEAIPIDHRLPDLRFAMRDDHGRILSQDDLRGHMVLLYFGYSGCGDACPLTLTRLTHLTAALDPTGQDLRILFVSVTPDSDTPALLHAYLNGYGNPVLQGLTGKGGEALARRLRAAWPVLAGSAPVHSTSVYVFDRAGHARVLLPEHDSDAQWRAAIMAARR